METTWYWVFVGALVTALATGVGALPLLALSQVGAHAQRLLGWGHAIAAGLMVAASAILIWEGIDTSASSTGLGMVCGLVAIVIASRFMSDDDERMFASLQGANAKRALLVIAVMTVHSAAEGVGLGVSFGEGQQFGWAVTALIALHNVPEGLAIALIMVPAGASVRAAAGWSIATSLPQPLIAVPAYAFVLAFAPALPWGLGFAGGAMIWMSLAHLVPEAHEALGRRAWPITSAVVAVCLVGFSL